MQSEISKTHWYQKTGWIIFLLILCLPVGAILMWMYTDWNKYIKWTISGIAIVLFLISSLTSRKIVTTPIKPQTSHANCVGPDGKRIWLSSKACEEFNNSWKNANAKQTNTAVFDVPALVGKDLDGVIGVLGQPKGIDPTALQIQQGVTEWDKTFVKDGKELLVTYTISNRKIVDFFISPNDSSGVTSDKEALLKQENLKQDDPKYKVEFVKAIKDPSTFTGVKVIPNQ